jgi:hypothetical protein
MLIVEIQYSIKDVHLRCICGVDFNTNVSYFLANDAPEFGSRHRKMFSPCCRLFSSGVVFDFAGAATLWRSAREKAAGIPKLAGICSGIRSPSRYRCCMGFARCISSRDPGKAQKHFRVFALRWSGLHVNITCIRE